MSDTGGILTEPGSGCVVSGRPPVRSGHGIWSEGPWTFEPWLHPDCWKLSRWAISRKVEFKLRRRPDLPKKAQCRRCGHEIRIGQQVVWYPAAKLFFHPTCDSVKGLTDPALKAERIEGVRQARAAQKAENERRVQEMMDRVPPKLVRPRG